MTASDDVSQPFQDPNTGQWYSYDFTTGSTQPADPPASSSGADSFPPPSGSPSDASADAAPGSASVGTTDQATAPAGTVDLTPNSPASLSPAPAVPALSPASDRGSWVDLRVGGSDEDPQLESALIVADHENNGDSGTFKYLYVFPRAGAAYPTVADEGDGQDQYRTS